MTPKRTYPIICICLDNDILTSQGCERALIELYMLIHRSFALDLRLDQYFLDRPTEFLNLVSLPLLNLRAG
jgi:hypothetical protein